MSYYPPSQLAQPDFAKMLERTSLETIKEIDRNLHLSIVKSINKLRKKAYSDGLTRNMTARR